MLDVVALGELLIDFATLSADQAGYPTMQANPGGAPGNFLAALSKYGRRTAFIGKVGADTFGDLLRNTMEQAGIETRGIVSDPTVFTTLAFVTLDAHGDRSFSFARKPGADTQLCWEDVDQSLLDECQVFHFGTLSLTDQPAQGTTKQAVAYVKAQGKLITFDPNLRLPLWASPDEAKKQILWGLEQADVVKISDEEIDFLWGCSPEEGAQRLLEQFKTSLVMVTLGPKGCYLKNKNGDCRVGSPKVHPVDTTGAGDIFGGSAISYLLKTNKSPEQLTEFELEQMAEFACTAASISTETVGGIPSIPTEEKVFAIIQRKPLSGKGSS